jgi:dolichol-phosphate mannosyltransferase
MVRALGGVLREGDRVLVIDDASPDGTGEVADRLAAELPSRGRAAPDGEGGSRAGVHRGLPPGARGRRRSSCSRWTATSRTIRPPVRADRRRGGRRRPRAGSRYVPGARSRTGVPVRRFISSAATSTPGLAREPPPRPDGRVQALPRPGARDRRSGRDHLQGLRLSDRDHLPGRRAGFKVVEVPISFSDREHGHSKMSRGDRSRGDLEGAAPAPPGPHRPSVA